MNWNFGSADGQWQVSLTQGNAQSYGKLTHAGKITPVTGTSITSAGAVQISGGELTGELKAAGNPGHPSSLELTGTFAGAPIDATLVPMMDTSMEDIVDAYRNSYAVFTISGDHTAPTCTSAWQGGRTLEVVNGQTGLIGPVGFDYEVPKNTTFPDPVREGICQPNGANGSVELRIPSLSTLSGTSGPVLIQFLGEEGHFADPPFQKPHDEILGVFYESYKRNCLTIEYSNSGEPLTLVFNDGRKKSHKSIIIMPNFR